MNYVRLKNFEIGYSLPASVNQTLHINLLRFYVNGQNLFTTAKQHFIDPELQAGTDYPLQRIITGGLTLTF
jgi:hypothetical protein